MSRMPARLSTRCVVWHAILFLPILALALAVQSLGADPETPRRDAPWAADPDIVVERFASAPDIVHPVCLCLDRQGRLLVIESHTHFRPQGYQGPPHDRVRILEDTDGDGRADRFRTFFEGVRAAMDIACHPDGSIYLATRSEILKLNDRDGDGIADGSQRIVLLDTPGDYPHNGLSGLAFDRQGHLFFGMGENLGVQYRLVGSDGTQISDEGEGGNVFWCTAEGRQLRRVATGFWNPFGLCCDEQGRLFAVDNDPDAMPPCRLLHVVEGGDYGYQFRYGRSGRHPFQAWNGQLPGTLPMVCGVGEGPCEVIRYHGSGLPGGLDGDLLVTAWADHRIERYRLVPHGASFRAERLEFVRGPADFRPVGLAQAPDGSLFVSDWVLANYDLHGRGAVWHIRPRGAAPALPPGKPAQLPAPRPDPLAAIADIPADGAWPRLQPLLVAEDPFVRHAATRRLSQLPELLAALSDQPPDDPRVRQQLLLAQRMRDPAPPEAARWASRWLRDPDPDVRFLAVKWIADKALCDCRPDIERLVEDADLDSRQLIAAATALARLQGQQTHETHIAELCFQRLRRPGAPPALRSSMLRSIPATYPKLSVAVVRELLAQPDPTLRLEAVRLLQEHPDGQRFAVLQQLAQEASEPELLRAEALVGLAAAGVRAKAVLLALLDDPSSAVRHEALRGLTGLGLDPREQEKVARFLASGDAAASLAQRVLGKPFAAARPDKGDLAAWQRFLEGPADADAGRRVFFHSRLAGCARCHKVEGRGQDVGPDLSQAGRLEPGRLLEALLQPSRDVAPHYQPWVLATADGQVRTGLLLRTYLDEATYVDEAGRTFVVKSPDVLESKPARRSIMPDGLVELLTDQELRDLMAYLRSRR